jgi:3-methyl-2-oxobutanoate hydroxymethyltransferase
MSTQFAGAPKNKALRPVTIRNIQRFKQDGRKIVCLTAYDYTFARLVDRAGVDLVLVGDSLGNVVQGHDTTIPVTLDDIIYHSRAVRRGLHRAHLVGDMPFMTYQISVEQALQNAARLMREGGCQSVKLEGGRERADTVRCLVDAGIPVMGHLGLTPQSIHQLGGHRVQGRDQEGYQKIIEDARTLQEAGAYAIVLECVPESLGNEISQDLDIPTIGIGAGAGCDGQILVIQDALGLLGDFQPRFVRQFAQLGELAVEAIEQYGDEVRAGSFPSPCETYDPIQVAS